MPSIDDSPWKQGHLQIPVDSAKMAEAVVVMADSMMRSIMTGKRREEDWTSIGPLVEKYSIGSEGSSAWAWVGENPEDMQLVGATGYSQLNAITKVLRALGEDV